MFLISLQYLYLLQHAVPNLKHLGAKAIVGLDIGTTRSTASVLDERTGLVHVLCIKGTNAPLRVTFVSSEYVHYNGGAEFKSGIS